MGKKSLAALLCATMAMTACMLPATAAMADEPLKIEFFQQKGEEGPQKGYKEIIDKFNKENSDIEIEMNTVSAVRKRIISTIFLFCHFQCGFIDVF